MQSKIIPGLLDNSIEFFNHSGDLKYISNGIVKDFNEASISVIMILKEALSNSPEAKLILMEWYPDSEFNQLKKFASCRFGGVDYTPDLVENNLQDGEYWPCPLRGSCIGEGKVCKSPKYNGHELSKIDIELIKLTTTDSTNEVIAEKLGLPLGTFHKHKLNLYQKLGNLQTKQCVTKVAYHLNII